MTPTRLYQIRARLAPHVPTEGVRWCVHDPSDDERLPGEDGVRVVEVFTSGAESPAFVAGMMGEGVADFVAHAPEDIGFLLREVERLTQERAIFLGDEACPDCILKDARLHDIAQAFEGYGGTERSPLSKRVSGLVGEVGTLRAEYRHVVEDAERVAAERDGLRASAKEQEGRCRSLLRRARQLLAERDDFENQAFAFSEDAGTYKSMNRELQAEVERIRHICKVAGIPEVHEEDDVEPFDYTTEQMVSLLRSTLEGERYRASLLKTALTDIAQDLAERWSDRDLPPVVRHLQALLD